MRWLSTPTLSVAASLICFVSSSPVAHSVERSEEFSDVLKHCELAHLWKDPQDPKGFSECMKQGHYRLYFSPTCQTGSRRARCYDLDPQPPVSKPG